MNNRKLNMSCNKPVKSWRTGKKRVVKACSNNIEKIIHFGATGYGHNYSSAARNSFRARHKCSKATNKLTANYWACKNLWTKGGSRLNCPSNRKCKYSSRRPIKRSRSRRPIKRSRSRRPIKRSRSRRPIKRSRSRRPIKRSRSRRPIKRS